MNKSKSTKVLATLVVAVLALGIVSVTVASTPAFAQVGGVTKAGSAIGGNGGAGGNFRTFAPVAISGDNVYVT